MGHNIPFQFSNNNNNNNNSQLLATFLEAACLF